MLSTKPINTNISVGVRNKIQVTELRQKHLKLFKLENLEISPRFIPKSAYIPRGESERFLSFYPSELEPGTDIYTEFVSSTLEPEDPERRLYKWLFNAEFKTEYATTEPHPRTGDVRYLIPIGELIDVASLHLEVKKPSEPIQVEKQLSLDIPTTSAPRSLSIRYSALVSRHGPGSAT